MKKITMLLTLLFSAGLAAAAPTPSGPSTYTGPIVDSPAVVYSADYQVDMAGFQGSRVSAQVVYSSNTFETVAFTSTSYTLNGSSISAPAHGLPRGLPVLFTVADGTAPTPLVDGTTYYIIPVNSNYIRLATTSAYAQAGTPYEVLTSSNTGLQNYNLTPLAITDSSYTWQSSNDGLTWATNPSSGTYTINSYSVGGTTLLVDFGFYNFRYLRMAYTAPTQGAISLKAVLYIKQDGIGRF